ncbi:MAG: osmoprotectant transport system permease protein [Solirubrobacteraceae bacterium]|jgi:osmoprotectant transport system permease protein|nr:osmoprotectant transport system permease protein [Solirubrobacteraceae bacterium]
MGAPMKDFTNAIQFIGDNTGLLLGRAGSQLAFTVIAFAIAVVLALPLGVWLGHRHRGSFAAINISNVGRALPSLAIIAMLIAVIGIGDTPLVIALVLLAVPPMLTNAYVAIDTIDRDVVDAARGLGMTESEILRRVELPLGIPLLFAGVRTATIFIVATVPLGAIVGASGGLGDIIANQASYHFEGVVGAAMCVAVLALLLDGALALVERLVTPTGVSENLPSERKSVVAPGPLPGSLSL